MTLELALFGHPVAHSRSPALHAAFGRAAGFDLRYRAIDVPDGDLATAVQRFVAAGGRGANITLPFKFAGLDLCTTLTPRALAAGAVNLLSVEADGSLLGDDVDGLGLVRDLTTNQGFDLRGAEVLVCGAGGAARGCLPALQAAGAQVRVAHRDAARRQDLAASCPEVEVVEYAAVTPGAGFVINATSASLRGEVPPLAAAVLRDAVCYDLVYADEPTAFVRAARAAGARTALDGWGMLVEQAAESFAVWTGVRPDTGPHLRR
jgi:shikimate dehydrogenase